MPKASDTSPRSRIADLLAWMGVLLIWALFLLAMALWETAGWFRGYAGRRRRRRLLFLLPLLAFSLMIWKVGPVFWARFALLDQAAFAARRSEGLETAQVIAKLRAEALRLGLTDIQRQDGAIEVELAEEEGSRRCRVRVEFKQEVRLLRWAWSIPIRGAVDEAILPKPARPWSEDDLVR